MADQQGVKTLISQDFVQRVAGMTRQQADWFTPLIPLRPVAPPEVSGRAWDYPVGYNVQLRPRAYDAISFDDMIALADSYDLLRLVIETRKDQIEAYEWNLVPTDDDPASDAELKQVKAFFAYPDREHPWRLWLRALLEDMFVCDAVVVYPRATKGGSLYSLDLIDPATIKRVIDTTGRTPMPPAPAYQQILKGLPAVDYTVEELGYFVRNYRSRRVYGFSPVEQVIMTVNIALRRQLSQLQFYTEGTIPDAFAGVPESWTIEQIKHFSDWWNGMLENNTAERRKMKFLPFDPGKIAYPKLPDMKDQYDEWLARIVCYAFGVDPTPFIKAPNRATAEAAATQAKEEGLLPTLGHLETLFNMIIERYLKLTGMKFRWSIKSDVDPMTQAQIDQIYLNTRVYDINEIRDRRGDDLLSDEELKQRATAPPLPSNPFSAAATPPSPFGGLGTKPPETVINQ